MAIRVGITGFGRIGRNIFRALYDRDDIHVVAVNDIAPPESIEYLLRYDTIKGRLPDAVRIVEGNLYAQGRMIPVLHERLPGEIPWYEYGADVVVESTGRYRNRVDLLKHLDAGADRVIVTQPPRDAIDAFFVRGVTPEPVARDARLWSCGSSTGNCTAVLLAALDRAFGVEEGAFTSVHAYTTEQSLIDAPMGPDLRLSRAAIENIVPVQSWTQELVGTLFPKLRGRFSGNKLNVPVHDVSSVDLTVRLSRGVTVEQVNEAVRSAAAARLAGVLDVESEPIVSSDVVGRHESCIFDSLATMVCGDDLVKVLGWYDQGGGLAHRVVDLITRFMPGRVGGAV